MVGTNHSIRSFVYTKLFRRDFNNHCFTIGGTAYHYSLGHKYFALFGNGYSLIYIFSILQNFTAEERDRGTGFKRNRRFPSIDSNCKSFEIHTRKHTYHSAPSVTHKGNTFLRTHKADNLFGSKIIGEVKIEIATNEQLTVFSFITPNC